MRSAGTLAQLREQLRRQGQPTSGNKAKLLARLQPPVPFESSHFGTLDSNADVRLITDLISEGDALCVALVCSRLRDVIFSRWPRTAVQNREKEIGGSGGLT
jgi:hypothetical protein